jgi:uncharacterized membrane protein YagU involved in acid resistance
MLPHSHFIIASLIIAPVSLIFFPEKSATEVGKWILVGGLLSSAIDIDIVALVFLKSRKENRLKPFRNPLKIYREFGLFMDTITETGVLRLGLLTHFTLSIFLISIFYLFPSEYFVPASLGVLSHIASDIPNLQRLNK